MDTHHFLTDDDARQTGPWGRSGRRAGPRFEATSPGGGQVPASLDVFAPDAPMDRFSGEPYLYRVLPDGFTVYSVGVNGQDDGGTSPGDLVFRVKPQAALRE